MIYFVIHAPHLDPIPLFFSLGDTYAEICLSRCSWWTREAIDLQSLVRHTLVECGKESWNDERTSPLKLLCPEALHIVPFQGRLQSKPNIWSWKKGGRVKGHGKWRDISHSIPTHPKLPVRKFFFVLLQLQSSRNCEAIVACNRRLFPYSPVSLASKWSMYGWRSTWAKRENVTTIHLFSDDTINHNKVGREKKTGWLRSRNQLRTNDAHEVLCYC